MGLRSPILSITDSAFGNTLIAAPTSPNSFFFSNMYISCFSFERLRANVSPAIPPPIIAIFFFILFLFFLPYPKAKKSVMVMSYFVDVISELKIKGGKA